MVESPAFALFGEPSSVATTMPLTEKVSVMALVSASFTSVKPMAHAPSVAATWLLVTVTEPYPLVLTVHCPSVTPKVT